MLLSLFPAPSNLIIVFRMRVEIASHTRSLGQKLIDEKVILPVAGRAHTLTEHAAHTRRRGGAPPTRVSGSLAHPGGISWSIPTPFARYPSFVRPMALELRSFHDREKRLPGKTFRERVYMYVCVCVCVRVLRWSDHGPGCRSGYSKKCCCLWRIDRSMASSW